MKKPIVFFIILLFCLNVFAVDMKSLLRLSVNNNSDIRAARLNYENALVGEKGVGVYAPNLSVSGSYDFNDLTHSLSATGSYSQQVISGTNIGIDGTYQRARTDVYGTEGTTEDVSISLTVQQALNPFWISKDNIGDPNRLAKEYETLNYYYTYLDTVKTIFINIIQNYVKVMEYRKQIEILENNISLKEMEIQAVRQLIRGGEENELKLISLNNELFSYQQSLNSYLIELNTNIQNINLLCMSEITKEEVFVLDDEEELKSYVYEVLGNNLNPLLKSYEVQLNGSKNSLILAKQNSSPVLSFSVKPQWGNSSLNNETIYSTTVYVGMDFTPMFSNIYNREEEKIQNSISALKEMYNYQMLYGVNLKKNYENFKKLYHEQRRELVKIIENEESEIKSFKTEYEKGRISLLEYNSEVYKLKNHKISLEITDLNIWLYGVLESLY